MSKDQRDVWKNRKKFEKLLPTDSSAKQINQCSDYAIKHAKWYKTIVHMVEKHVRMGDTRANTKLPQLYTIHSICQRGRKHLGKKEPFIGRFAKNIDMTFRELAKGHKSDRKELKRVAGLWAKDKWFPREKMKKIQAICQKFPDDGQKRGTTPKKTKSKKVKDEELVKTSLLNALSILQKADSPEDDFDYGEDNAAFSGGDIQKLLQRRKREETELRNPRKRKRRPSSVESLKSPDRSERVGKRKKTEEPINVMPKQIALVNSRNDHLSDFAVGTAPVITNMDKGMTMKKSGINREAVHRLPQAKIIPPRPKVRGWVVHEDQKKVKDGHTRVLSTTVWLGFPREAEPPSPHSLRTALDLVAGKKGTDRVAELDYKAEYAFAKYRLRRDAEVLFREAERDKLPGIKYKLKPLWACGPDMVKGAFNFENGIGYTKDLGRAPIIQAVIHPDRKVKRRSLDHAQYPPSRGPRPLF